MAVEIRPITAAEWPQFQGAFTRTFGGDPAPDQPIRLIEILPVARTLAAFDGDEIVGTFASFPLDLTVPGGVVAAAGTTIVSVAATHRRRGMLSQMMRRHLDNVRAEGRPVAALWASEAAIYGRYGYGSASDMVELKVGPGAAVVFPAAEPGISFHNCPVEDQLEVLPPIYDATRRSRPGMFARSAAWWEHRRLPDPEERRNGASARRTVVARRDGTAVGYASYRQKVTWGDGGPDGRVEVVEVIAVDDAARRSLWSYLGNIDLCPIVNHWNMPVDDPLWLEVPNPRAFVRRVSDALWVRLVDVEQALAMRTYGTDGTLALAVEDGVCGWNTGTVRLDVVGGVAGVAATDEPADVTCDVATLGAMYLGGRSAVALAAAGRVRGDAAAVRLMDDMFRSSLAPWCQEIF